MADAEGLSAVSQSPDGQLEVLQGAFGPVRSFAAEYLSALSFVLQDGDRVVLLGGKNPMYDIATDPYFTDIKTLLPLEPHEVKEAEQMGIGSSWKLRLPDSGVFPIIKETKSRGAIRKTHLGLVRLTARYTVKWTGHKLITEVEPVKFVCSWVPTEDVNAAIAEYTGTYYYIPNDWLSSYPQYELPVGVGWPEAGTQW